jgi:hypothetical protein
MSEGNAMKMMESLLDERIIVDLDNEINNKKSKPISNFVLDQMSMRFGLKTLAIKNVANMKFGILKKIKTAKRKSISNDLPQTQSNYGQFLLQILGIDGNPGGEVPEDHIDLVVKARAVFQEAYESYKKIMSIKPKMIKDQMKNLYDPN